MPSPTTNKCVCTLYVKDILGADYITAELVCTPVRSFIESGNLVIAAPKRAVADATGLCTLTLVESSSASREVVFTLNYNNGSSLDTVVFDPITIPNQASLDLSTVLTISRG